MSPGPMNETGCEDDDFETVDESERLRVFESKELDE